MADENLILIERHGDVAWLRLNIPQRLNPLAQPLQVALRAQLAALREDRSVRALVITGVGKAFCVGADLGAMRPPSDKSLGEQTADTMVALSNRLIEDIRDLPFPVVSAVNGPCAGPELVWRWRQTWLWPRARLISSCRSCHAWASCLIWAAPGFCNARQGVRGRWA